MIPADDAAEQHPRASSSRRGRSSLLGRGVCGPQSQRRQATLSCSFYTREDLIAAVFADRMDAYAGAVAVALADRDPWHGFTGYIQTVCAMQAVDRGFATVLTMSSPPPERWKNAAPRPTTASLHSSLEPRPPATCARTFSDRDKSRRHDQ
jgi:hypothetical protein